MLGRHPRGAPGQQPRRVELGGDVGERERDALLVEDRLAERLALGRVVARELERRARDAERLGGDHRPRLLERAERRRAPVAVARCSPRPAGARAARRRRAGSRPGSGSSRTAARRCARRGSRASRACARARSPGVPPGTMNSAWPRWPSSGSTVALTTCTSAMPPLPIQILWPSSTHSSPSRRARVRRLRDVAAALGLGHAERGELEVAGLAEALRRPAQQLLGRRRLRHRRQRERRHHDAEPDPGAAPEQLLHEQRQREAGRVADQVAVEERVVEALLGGRLQHRPTGTPPRGRGARRPAG